MYPRAETVFAKAGCSPRLDDRRMPVGSSGMLCGKQGTKMPDKSNSLEYVTTLCHMRNGALEPYHSHRFFAVDKAEAIRKATEWRVTAASTIDEKTWLQVILNGAAIYSEDLGGF
jgi:hypothetical protein